MASSSSDPGPKTESGSGSGGGGGGAEASEAAPNDQQLLYRGLKKAKKERGCTAKERISKMPPCAAGKRSSIYRGVTRLVCPLQIYVSIQIVLFLFFFLVTNWVKKTQSRLFCFRAKDI